MPNPNSHINEKSRQLRFLNGTWEQDDITTQRQAKCNSLGFPGAFTEVLRGVLGSLVARSGMVE